MSSKMFTMPGTGGLAAQQQQLQSLLAAPATPQAPTPLPDPYGPEARAAQLEAARKTGKQGRAGTMLTTPASRTLAAGLPMSGTYQARNLGGTA